MLQVSFINKNVNFKYDVPVDEFILQNLTQDGVKETINPKVEKYLLEWPEAKEVVESISSLTKESVDLVTHQFLRLVETFEKKGAIIVNNEYENSEQFLKVFKKYVKQFNAKNNIREFPPDMAIMTLASLIALKFQELEFELPEDCLKLYLNMSENQPLEEGPFDENDVPADGKYWVNSSQN